MTILDLVGTSNLSTGEWLLLAGSILKHLKSFHTEDSEIRGFRTKFEELHTTLNELCEKTKRNSYKSVWHKADAVRDNTFLAFRDYLKACNLRNNSVYKNSSSILLNAIRDNGWSLHSRNVKESFILSSLIKKIDDNEGLKNAISDLNASEWYNEMVEAEQEFQKIDSLKKLDEMEHPKVGARKVCKEILSEIRNLDVYFRYKYMSGSFDWLNDLVDLINQELEFVKHKAHLRIGDAG